MNREIVKPVVGVVAYVAIVALLVVAVWLGFGVLRPPVDVYARPTPSIGEEPVDLLPLQVAGFDLITTDQGTFSDGGKGANGTYQGGIQIGVNRYSSSAIASFTLDTIIAQVKGADSFASVSASEQHWFTATSGDVGSFFAWRKGAWMFIVFAPDEALRDQVVQELNF